MTIDGIGTLEGRAHPREQDTDGVALRLICRHGERAVERTVIENGRVWLRTVMPIASREMLDRLRASDALARSTLESEYDRILKEYMRVGGARLAALSALESSMDDCDHVALLDGRIRPAIQAVGAEQYLFSVIHRDRTTGDPSQYYFLCGYEPEWANIYLHQRRVFLYDPMFTHAFRSANVIYGSAFSRDGMGLREAKFADTATDYGINSWIAVPVFHCSPVRIGVLHIANGTRDQRVGEAMFTRSMLLIRGLASELLHWHLVAQERDLALRYALSEKELILLKIFAEGRVSSDAADHLHVSIRTIYDWRVTLCRKLGTSTIKAAVQVALDEGLLASEGKVKEPN
ncbi:autoinducer binding domain-containing protein [Burkholderia stagnalis]